MIEKLEPCAVTQADRELRDQIIDLDWPGNHAVYEYELDQIIARHRLAHSTPANGEQVERLEAEITRLRGLLIDPGRPAWEDARAVLATELRKAEMPDHARAVENAEGPYIPSHIALNLIAHARSATPTQDARERVKALEEALERIDWPAIHAFQDELRKGQDIYEDAGGFMARAIKALFGIKSTDPVTNYRNAAAALVAALGNKETDRHG